MGRDSLEAAGPPLAPNRRVQAGRPERVVQEALAGAAKGPSSHGDQASGPGVQHVPSQVVERSYPSS